MEGEMFLFNLKLESLETAPVDVRGSPEAGWRFHLRRLFALIHRER